VATPSNSGKHGKQPRPHWIEWLTGLVSTLMVLAMTGWILFEAASTADRPPELSAHVLSVDRAESGWRVMIEVRNQGDQAAAAVDVKASLLDGETEVEQAETTFDYVAAESTTRGGLYFTRDPARFRLQVVPSGFTEP
jgi:uncharacterized protein (TIGR02588 family)